MDLKWPPKIHLLYSLVVLLPVLDGSDIREDKECASVDRVHGCIQDGTNEGLEEDDGSVGDK